MIDKRSTLKKYIKAELYRYATDISLRAFLRCWFIPGFRFTFWLRICQYRMTKRIWGVAYIVSRFMVRHYSFKYGIYIHPQTEIGYGLYIGHCGGIVVNPGCKIGNNVNLSPGILLGQAYKKDGTCFGFPIVGDRVFLANSAKVVGDVHIGNDAVVGINSVVLSDIEDNAVAVGQPAVVKSHKGSSMYLGSYLNEIE